MTASTQAPSARREQLLELAYGYVKEHGLTGLSLRPLADAVGSSPRVLLYLFGSKDELVRALLARARHEELTLLRRDQQNDGGGDGGDDQAGDLAAGAAQLWQWLSAPDHRGLLRLWVEAYAHALIEPTGPWAGFAEQTIRDWLNVLAEFQPAPLRHTTAGVTQRTLALAVLRGALLDLLATDDRDRTTTAVHHHLQNLK